MISFVWSSKYPFYAGTGGSENYTAGHIRELMRRGIPTRVITIGHGEKDGRDDFPDIAFVAFDNKEQLSELDDTLVFVTYPLNVPTKKQSYVVLHIPPPTHSQQKDPLFDPKGLQGKRLLTPSKYAARLWKSYRGRPLSRRRIVYPFAEKVFSEVARPPRKDNAKIKVLFAGRLIPDKGIYTLLAALHMDSLKDLNVEVTITTAGSHTEDGQILLPMLQVHPGIKLVDSRRSHQGMAELMAEHDIVVQPSTAIFWQETFGMISVEAQHAGCRVVASRAGGLPETNCGSLILVEADNPNALAKGIAKAVNLGPVTATERTKAGRKFTVKQSVDTLLAIMAEDDPVRKPLLDMDGVHIPLPFPRPQLSGLGRHWRQPVYQEEPVRHK